MTDFYIGQGDLPLFAETLKDENNIPVDISGATITMSMIPIRGGADALTTSATTNAQVGDGSDGSKGKIIRQFVTTETSVAGDYLVRIIATKASKPQTFPNAGYLLVTVTPSAVAQQHRYLNVEEFKATARLQGVTAADGDITMAIEIASRALEDIGYYNGPWTLGTPGEIRYYTANTLRTVLLGDVIEITKVELDQTGYFDYDSDIAIGSPGGTWATTLNTSDYWLDPDLHVFHGLKANGGDGEPFRELRLRRGSTVAWLPSSRDSIKVTGTYGWETVPSGVRWAVQLIAIRLLRRTRDAPYGILSFGQDTAIARVRDILADPELAMAMAPLSLRDRMVV
jgi:hypothetical protein